jgi:hypothetical protein
MWTPLDVRDRFLEAAEVERRTPRGQWGPSQKLSYYPEYEREFSDKAGWSEQTWQDIYDARNNRPVKPTPSERSRAEEVLFEWTPLVREDRRKLVWFWAHCAAGGGKFSVVYRRMGLRKRTAYDRIDRVWVTLSNRFVNDRRCLRLAGNIESCTLSDPMRGNCCLLNELPEAQSPRSWSDGEASGDHPDIRDFSWAQEQAEREAKRRRKAEAGVPKPETV